MSPAYDGQDRRKDARIAKNYNLFYHIKDSNYKSTDATFIKDISKSGLRFTTSKQLEPNTHIVFEISVPYIAPDRLVVEGVVISCVPITTLIFEIRAKFIPLEEETIKILNIIENRNLKEQKKHGLY